MAEEVPSNSILEVKLDYIQRDLNVIKKDVAEIKNDTITRREFETHVKDSEDKVRNRFLLSDQVVKDWGDKINFFGRVVYSVVALIVTSFIVAILKLVLK